MNVRFRIQVIAIVSTVLGDMCQDLCIRELGRSGCPKGSWCKNNYDCQSIFWTTTDRSAICIYTGSSGTCPSRYPVLCHDAAARLAGTSGSTSSTTTSTTGEIPTNVAAVPPRIISAEYLQAYREGRIRDNRPRVRVDFPRNEQALSYSLMFDTAANGSYMCLGSGGYPDQAHGSATVEGGQLAFGTDNCRREFPVERKQLEMIRLSSSRSGDEFIHSIELDLVRNLPPTEADVGKLAAGPSSDFARAVGVFTYSQHPDDAGTIGIGEPPALCPSGGPIRYYPIVAELSRHWWVVSGGVAVGDGQRFDIDWMVDTGATGYYLLSESLENFLRQLRSAGSEVVIPSGWGYSVVSNCRDYETRFPTIHYQIGDATSIVIYPRDYVVYWYETTDTCTINIYSDGYRDYPKLRLLTIDTLWKLSLTILDTSNSRIGFCT